MLEVALLGPGGGVGTVYLVWGGREKEGSSHGERIWCLPQSHPEA